MAVNRALLASLAVACLAPSASIAALNRAGDPNAPPLQIVFKPGQPCWRYTGREAFFSGSFRAGEHIIVTSAGEAHFGDPATGREIVRIVLRDISVAQRNPYRDLNSVGDGEYVIPLSGTYDIDIWPHAIQGFPGSMVVCKR